VSGAYSQKQIVTRHEELGAAEQRTWYGVTSRSSARSESRSGQLCRLASMTLAPVPARRPPENDLRAHRPRRAAAKRPLHAPRLHNGRARCEAPRSVIADPHPARCPRGGRAHVCTLPTFYGIYLIAVHPAVNARHWSFARSRSCHTFGSGRRVIELLRPTPGEPSVVRRPLGQEGRWDA
jgi:hypothetical protein